MEGKVCTAAGTEAPVSASKAPPHTTQTPSYEEDVSDMPGLIDDDMLSEEEELTVLHSRAATTQVAEV